MKRKNVIIVILLAFVCAVAIPAFAALSAVTESFNSSDVQEINNAMPATSKTKLGTRLEGLLKKEYSAVTADGAMDLDVDDAVVSFVTTAVQGTNDPSLANGKPGQIMTFVLITDGGLNATITPATKTGFTNLQLDDAKDSCSLRYVNDTVGWVVAGNAGCTIN